MRKFARVFGLALAVVTLFGMGTAGAQSNGLGITPRKDYTIKAGGKISDKLYVNNLSQKDDLRVSIRVVDFRAQDETGTPSLELAANAEQTPWSLKPFITLQSSVTIPAGKSTYVPFTIAVPAKQGAGSYYSAIEYVAQNAQTQQRVNIAASSASLVFVTVPGKATEQLVFKQFGTFVPSADDQTGVFKSMFTSTQPKVLAYRLQNNGNVAEQPQGSILIKNMFGKTARTVQKANPKNALALLGQTRRFETCIKPVQKTVTASNGQPAMETVCANAGLFPGRYTAELAVLYGLNGSNTQEVTASTTFWYLPWWSVASLIAIVLIIIVLVWLGIHMIRRRGKKAVAPAANQPAVPTAPAEDKDTDTPPSVQPTKPTASTTPPTPSASPEDDNTDSTPSLSSDDNDNNKPDAS